MKATTLASILFLSVAACGGDAPNGGGADQGGTTMHDMKTGSHDLAMSGGHDMARGGGPDMSQSGGADMAQAGIGDMAQSGNADMATGGGDGSTTGASVTTIITIVMENTSYTDVVAGATDPYIKSLIDQNGLATMYMDSGKHPSLPNYLYLVSGDPQYFGGFDVGPTFFNTFPVASDNLGKQMTTAGIPWRAYQESMGTPCNLSDNPPYATKHNPFIYFTDLQKNMSAQCADVDVDYTQFSADLDQGTYKFMWITPNLNSDGHDTDLATADGWLAQNVPPILKSAVFKKGGILFIVWDEGGSTGGFGGTDDHVAMIVISPLLKQAPMKLDAAYTHASYLKFVEDTFGLPELGAANDPALPSLADFFQ